MPMLIGITGVARAGKDTLAGYLRDYFGFTPMSFATPLKIAASIAFCDLPENFSTQEGKAGVHPYWNITRRKILQDFGEAMCKEFGDDFWIRRWYRDYFPLSETDNIVVSDVRKENEAAFIRQLGGVIIHLQRQGAGLKGDEAKHKTEQGVAIGESDLLMFNNGTLEQLCVKAHQLHDHLVGGVHATSRI